MINEKLREDRVAFPEKSNISEELFARAHYILELLDCGLFF